MDNATQDGDGSGTGAIQRTALSPPSTRPSPPPSLSTLPTEILSNILEEIPYHPSKLRCADLASLCLINHFFLDLARPLLYREVHLDFNQHYNESHSAIHRLVSTLLNIDHCSKLVKRVGISMDDKLNLEIPTLTHLLSQLKSLESIQTGEIEEEDQADFVQAILKHQSGVKHLELRDFALDWKFLDKLGALKTLVGRFDPSQGVEEALQDVELAFELDRFVSYSFSSLTNKTFGRILQSSWSSLTILAFPVNPDHVDFDLRRLENLNTLRIVLDDDENSSLEALNSHTTAQLRAKRSTVITLFVQQIRSILLSAQSLPIQTFSITVEENHVSDILATHLLLDLLPPTLRHLGTIFEVLESNGINSSELKTALRTGLLSHLERITIFPSNGFGIWNRTTRERDEACRRSSEFGSEIRVGVRWYSSAPGVMTPWYTIDPYYEENPSHYLAYGGSLLGGVPSSIRRLFLPAKFLTKPRWLELFPLTGPHLVPLLKHVRLYPPRNQAFGFFIEMPQPLPEAVSNFVPACERFGIS
ncbi:hypothetical protein JCM5353_008111, partial [Sporobolomyces roseus]